MGMFLRLENNSGLYTGGNYLVREEKTDDAGPCAWPGFGRRGGQQFESWNRSAGLW